MAERNEDGQLVISSKVRDWIRDEDAIEEIGNALAGWMERDEFLAQMLIALQKKGETRRRQKDGVWVDEYQPGPADCSDQSKYEAAHICASLQLLPTLGQVSLIPKGGGDSPRCEVTPQWQGYKSLMLRNPEVEDIDADIVFVGEDYTWDASTRKFDHSYDPFVDRDVDENLSNLQGGYLRITYTNGRPPKYHFLTKHTILKAKSCAQTMMIWRPFPTEMTIKTIYRNGYARRVVPIDPLVSRHMNVLIANEDKVHENNPTRAILNEAKGQPISDLSNEILDEDDVLTESAAEDGGVIEELEQLQDS